jgi:branched-chain amino acid transport system substrate-binding protein
VAQKAPRRVTRRELIGTSAAAGGAALVAGGLGGFFVGRATGDDDDGGGAAAAGDGEEIRAVGIFPLGGFIAADGEEMRNGVKMAIDEINANDGLLGSQIRYIEIDDGDSNAEDVTTAFNRAVETENPDVIFSGYHLASGPEFDIVADAERLYYNVNTQQRWIDLYDKNPQKYWGSFQCDPADTWYGGGFALWVDDMVKQGGLEIDKTAAILSGDDAYDSWIAQNFETKIKELGWEVIHKGTFTAGRVPDWGPLLSRVRSSRPGMLFTTDYNPADDAAMAKEWAQNPVPGTLVYQQYGPSVPEYLDLAGDAANGMIWATVLGLLPDKVGNDFRERYQAKYNKQPGWANAGGCFDSVMVWANAVAMAGDWKDYRRVAKETEKLVHRGTTGGISFVSHAGLAYPGQTKDPSLGQAHIIAQLQNGEQVVISPEPYTTGEFQPPPWFGA